MSSPLRCPTRERSLTDTTVIRTFSPPWPRGAEVLEAVMTRWITLSALLVALCACSSADDGVAGAGAATGDAGADGQLLGGDSVADAGFEEPKKGDGEIGKPCKTNEECKSGVCLEGYNGYVCTDSCVDSGACPTGWTCGKVYLDGGKSAEVCVPELNRLCQPCANDLDCLGGICLGEGQDRYCATPCGECPSTHSCVNKPAPDGSGDVPVCVPTSGSCSCGPETVGLVRACKASAGPKTCYGIETCQASGWGGCALPKEVCDGEDNNCDGVVDEGFTDAEGKYTTVAACGSCGNGCGALSFANASPKCVVDQVSARCELSCDAGFFDVNDNPNDGCECKKEGSVDIPSGKDSNCDGVDGQIDAAIFVAKTGLDTAAGTIDAPVASVQKGVELAKAQGKRDVYVATGVYEGAVGLLAGVNVYGGYSSDWKLRDPDAYQTVVLGVAPTASLPGAVNAIDLGNGVATFAGFTVYGANVKSKSQSTYGVYIRNTSAGLMVKDCRILAGDAANGLAGKAGTNGAVGKGGASGVNAKDIGKSICTSASNSAGGKGGVHACGGSSVSGGSGGTAVCPDYDEDGGQPKSSPYKQVSQATELGKDGKGKGAGKGGGAGFDSVIWEGGASCGVCSPPRKVAGGTFLETVGANGGGGANGAAGGAGGACATSQGQVVGGLWQAVNAKTGGAGVHGGGGGGGGAGGGVEVSTKCTKNALFKYPDLGGSGGGGGSGGCAGGGGTAGTGGGGSFGVFIVWTKTSTGVPKILGNQVVTGNGGEGGAGGQGGVGGAGGNGGSAGGDDGAGKAWCASGGGVGGEGGDGGHGGGGGGGCGGVSFGLFVSGVPSALAQIYKSANTVTVLGVPGNGGDGGVSLGSNGNNGSTGAGGAANF